MTHVCAGLAVAFGEVFELLLSRLTVDRRVKNRKALQRESRGERSSGLRVDGKLTAGDLLSCALPSFTPRLE